MIASGADRPTRSPTIIDDRQMTDREQSPDLDQTPPADDVAGTERYDTSVDADDLSSSHAHLIDMCGPNKTVLQVGPATYVSENLRERGCRVVAIEIDPAAARRAAERCHRVIVGDIEQLDLAECLGDERFDVVMLGHVLEHLVDPVRVLERVSEYLAPGGSVIGFFRNVAHGSVRLSLLTGRFRYTELGLLDGTRSRFFDRTGIEKLFADAGYAITEWRRLERPVLTSGTDLSGATIPPSVLEAVQNAPEALTYQFVVRAVPSGATSTLIEDEPADLAPIWRLHRRADDADRTMRRALARAVEAERAAREAEAISAQLHRQIRGLLDSRALRSTAPIRAGTNLVRRLLRKKPAPGWVEGHVEEIGYVSGGPLTVFGWCWSNAIRLPRLGVFVGGVCVHTWRPDRSRPDIAGEIGVNHELLGFDLQVEMPPMSAESEVVVAAVWPRYSELRRARVAELNPPDEKRVRLVYLESTPGGGRARIRRWLFRSRARSPYETWVYDHMLSPAVVETMRAEAASITTRPVVSIVMPVYNTDPGWLASAVQSVRDQVYDGWELCIADDGSTRPKTKRTLSRLVSSDPRIKFVQLPSSRGIAAATNAALSLATGEFVGFLDHDDELRPGALLEVVKRLNEQGDLDYVFSDEDKLDEKGRLYHPFFKPGWSPDLLTSVNYVTHFSVYRRSLVEDLGGLREGYEGSQDFDLVLRATEATDKIAHIPWPLYTWRAIRGSAALSAAFKPEAWEAGKRALEEALTRRGHKGTVDSGIIPGQYRVRYTITGRPQVTIIIPTRDHLELLTRCVESIRRLSTWQNFRILVIDNHSIQPETVEYLANGPFDVVQYPDQFNFSRMMNVGAQNAMDSDYVLFLNDDTEVISTDWIEAMLEHAQRRNVACVGARLLYPDGRPQHEGIIAEEGPCNIDFHSLNPLYLNIGLAVRNCAAVTAACMLIRKDVFFDLGGFDEHLDVAYNDVDIGLRALEKGYLNVYTPYAQLYHYEGATRGRHSHPTENTIYFEERWKLNGRRDPYYNPRFALRPPFVLADVRR